MNLARFYRNGIKVFFCPVCFEFSFFQNGANTRSVVFAAFIIPPKQDQAFMQGGTFVFKGPETLFAHYDPSTASHANTSEVIDTAVKAMKGSTAKSQ